MNVNETRERLILLLAGTVIASSRSKDELDYFVRCLGSSDGIVDEIIRHITPLTEAKESKPLEKPDDDYGDAVITMTLNALRASGISKKSELMSIMKKRAPNFTPPPNIEKMSYKELLRRFGSQTSIETVRSLPISSRESTDPYLEGIRTKSGKMS